MSQPTALSQQTALSGAIAQTKIAQTKIAQLIWLGAGSASQPGDLVAKAEKVLLVEARAAACQQLSKQFSQHSNIVVKHAVINEQGGEVSFTDYNLAEYSAVSSATGLIELFPGLKVLKTQTQSSAGITTLLQPLALSGDNNVLVIDIADLSLGLLTQLQADNLLTHFSRLWLQGSDLQLYKDGATKPELTAWLQQHGFMLTSEDNTDPDLPWLQFSLNPLWQQLQQSQAELLHVTAQKQQAEQTKTELATQLAATTQQATDAKQQAAENSKNILSKLEVAEKNSNKLLQQLEEQKLQYEQNVADFSKQLTNAVSENETLQQQLTAVKVAAEKTQADLSGQLTGMDAELNKAHQQLATANQQAELLKQQTADVQQKHVQHIAKLQSELEHVSKHAASRLDKIAQLDKINRQLTAANSQLAKRQHALEQEMLKAQAQIDIIKDLLLKQ